MVGKKNRFLENKLAVVGTALILIMVILAVFAPLFCADPLAVSPVRSEERRVGKECRR